MRKLLVALGVLALVFVVADRVAKHVVESTLADHVEQMQSVDGVDVGIAGFPFLTQVLGNHFDEVDVTLPHLDARTSAGSIEVQDVRVSLHDVETSDRFTRATAASATGSGFVPYGAFDQFDPITVEYGGTSPNGTAYLDISAPSLGAGTVRVAPSAADGMSLNLEALSVLSAALPRELRTFVSAAHEFGGLPNGLVIKRLEATEDGLRVTLAGSDVTIAR
jgi:hypothetical protein